MRPDWGRAVIRNEKAVCPKHPDGPRCLQLETAMGAAIECFEGAAAICVPRDRFAPVKTTSDLLRLWSDVYGLSEDLRMVVADECADREVRIDLDPRFYGRVDDLQARFSEGPPSLARCRRLEVIGDHRFGANVAIEGHVRLVNDSDTPVEIPAGTRLSDRADRA